MTSQQLLMNHLGVALASDSTVTMGNSGRTFSTVNKIFSLAGRQPVAFMVSNAANYIPAGISWERVIGLYREYRGEEELAQLVDYVSDFKKFITSHESLNVVEVNDIAIQSDLISEFTRLVTPAEQKEKMKRSTGYSGEQVWKETDLTQYFDDAIHKRVEDLLLQTRTRSQERFNGENPEEWANHQYKVRKIHIDNIGAAANEFCKRHEINMYEEMCEIFHYHLCAFENDFKWRATSKIVITGFGKTELKPTMSFFEVGCDVGSGPFSPSTRYYIRNRRNYSDLGSWLQEDNEDDPSEYLWSTIGFSNGFAQKDNMEALLAGIHPQTRDALFRYLPFQMKKKVEEEILHIVSDVPGVGKATLAKIAKQLEAKNMDIYKTIDDCVHEEVMGEWMRRRGSFDAVTAKVPVEELARFVEVLVSLEAQVSHYLHDIRSVGGPIDVATITKEDGFLWVKSKQQYNKQLNPRQGEVERDSASLI